MTRCRLKHWILLSLLSSALAGPGCRQDSSPNLMTGVATVPKPCPCCNTGSCCQPVPSARLIPHEQTAGLPQTSMELVQLPERSVTLKPPAPPETVADDAVVHPQLGFDSSETVAPPLAQPSGSPYQVVTVKPPPTPAPVPQPVRSVPEPVPSVQEPARPAPAPEQPAAVPDNAVRYLPEPSLEVPVPRHAAPPRKSFVDLTAEPWFGHAGDYGWLSGRVLYSRSSNTWRLHYASLDDNDPYGGTVTLVGSDQLQTLKDGQSIRVKGHLVDPEKRESDSPYEVSAVEMIPVAH